MRKKNVGSPPPFTPKSNDRVITQEREYELITPLFGGGVQPKESDHVTMIRGTEIRGQLRFWWRACCGGQFDGNLAKMKEAEDNLWGKANKKKEQGLSPDDTVQIVVEASHNGTSAQPFDENGRPRNTPVPPYAAFPLQPDNSKGIKPGEVYQGVKFKLTISFPRAKETDIKAALWAWETFGGIGGRTRRGFGALRLRKLNGKDYTDIPLPPNVPAWISKKLAEYIPNEHFPAGVPHLSKNVQLRVTRYRFDSPVKAWGSLISALRNFRQKRTKGATGRSLWPEAEAIRRIASQGGNDPSAKFPRAAFGLPIIFHFTGERQMNDVMLKGEVGGVELERLASPLILRPLLCNNNQSVGLALLLQGTRPIPGQLALSEKGKKNILVHEALTRDEAKAIDVLNGETDVLKAFMNTFD